MGRGYMRHRVSDATPEQTAAAETIKLAMDDLDKLARLIRKGVRRPEILREYEDLLRWFDRREQGPFAYGWCLSVCNLNSVWARRQIELITDGIDLKAA